MLGHESEGTVTLAGLRAWSRRVRAEAEGGTEMFHWDGVGRPCQHIPGAGQIKDRRMGGISELARQIQTSADAER